MLAQVLSQDWFVQNVVLLIVLLTLIQIIIVIVYVSHFVKIVRQGLKFKQFRRGKLIKEGRGGFVVLIPFIDKLEIEDETLRFGDRRYLRALVKTVPPSERYLHLRKGIPVKEYQEGERIFRIPFFDWIEIKDEQPNSDL